MAGDHWRGGGIRTVVGDNDFETEALKGLRIKAIETVAETLRLVEMRYNDREQAVTCFARHD